jgi:hypothetical protein
MALVTLIFVLAFSYFSVAESIQIEIAKRELREATDYVSNTLENLRFLANSTVNTAIEGGTPSNVSLEKELSLPSTIKGSVYAVEIVGDGNDASEVSAYLKDRPYVRANSSLMPGLKTAGLTYVESSDKKTVAGCRREGTDLYVWISTS